MYYFSDGEALIKAIETQIQRDRSVNNEYYLADAINILVEDGRQIRTEKVSRWLDAGTPESVLETNAYLLQHRPDSQIEYEDGQSNVLIHPVYIHESARVENSIIGPNITIGENCSITRSILKDAIVDDDSSVSDAVLTKSLISKGCTVSGIPMQEIMADYEKT